MVEGQRANADRQDASLLDAGLFALGLAVAVFTIISMLWPAMPRAASSQSGERTEVEVLPKFVTTAGDGVDGVESTVRYGDTNITSFRFFGAASTSMAAIERFCSGGRYFPSRPTSEKNDAAGEANITQNYLGMTIGNDKVCIQDQATGRGEGLNVDVVQMDSGGFRTASGERVPMNRIALHETSSWKDSINDKVIPALFGVGLTLFLDRIKLLSRRRRRRR